MSKFKVGDKVRTIYDCGSSCKGSVYTVAECWYNFLTEKWYVSLEEHLSKSPKHSHCADSYELVEPNPVLTPEEVFEHLRKGTPMQIKSMRYTPRDVTVQWVDIDEDFTEGLLYDTICSKTFRLKPEPEVIELNGKKYREIVE